MSIQMKLHYECDYCDEVEEIEVFPVEFYYDYLIYPEGVEWRKTKIKWHDNVLYSYKGEDYEQHEGDYELLCDKCYNELKEEYEREYKEEYENELKNALDN